MDLETKTFVMCNACERYAEPFATLEITSFRQAGARVDHWPCSMQERGHWSVHVLLAHQWRVIQGGDYECANCGAWTAGYNSVPRYGCRPAGETALVRYA